MDVLVALGTSASYFYSVCALQYGAITGFWSPTYFETSATLITFVLFGKYLETLAKGKTSDAIKRLVELAPATATLLVKDKELDVLISLSIASEYYEGKTCCPILSAFFANEVPPLSAKSLGHPVLKGDTLGDGTFVTNDITLGGSDNASFILLTGPNMGGKSTLLRQVCLAVILGQIGADVPAETFELSPIDRIFVRTGPHIMFGGSIKNQYYSQSQYDEVRTEWSEFVYSYVGT